MKKLPSQAGKTIGNWKVLEEVPSNSKSHRRWLCACICGNKKILDQNHLLRQKINSCGCKNLERLSIRKDHGFITGTVWSKIKVLADKGRRAAKPLEFSITIEEMNELLIKQEHRCALSGIPINMGSNRKGNNRTASLDRKDSSKGYTLDNVQWVHKDINLMKNIFDTDYFIKLCKNVAAYGFDCSGKTTIA